MKHTETAQTRRLREGLRLLGGGGEGSRPLSSKTISHSYPSLKLVYFCENEVEIFNIAAQQSILEHKSGQRFTVLFLLIF